MPASSEERVRTLGLRTALAVESARAAIEERGEFVAVRTPENPDYHFGNYLIFDRPPRAGDEDRWPAAFEGVFGNDPRVRHAAFAWSGEDARHTQPFVERGYRLQRRAILTADALHEFPAPQGLYVRRLRCDNDWNMQLELGLATRDDVYEPEEYARFQRAQVAYHRRITARFGAWFGAFDGPQLVGSCGVFSIGDGLARYQDVGVLPAYRNRGVARCLIGAAGRFAFDRFGASQLVIVAAADDFPRSIYERCGFTLYERESALWKALR